MLLLVLATLTITITLLDIRMGIMYIVLRIDTTKNKNIEK